MQLSLIIPVYNTQSYLEECLESVIAQQFTHWECLLINDGSTDNSGSICNRYAEKDSRFKVFHTLNQGVSAARNLGLKEASGTYIAFIDSDDTVSPHYLLNLYQEMIKGEAELVVSGMKLVKKTGTHIHTASQALVTITNKDSEPFVELNRKFLLYGPVIKLYWADIIRNNGIDFPLGLQYGEDLVFNLKYLEQITTISVLDSPDYNYRIIGNGTLSSSPNSRDFNTNYSQWKMIKALFEKKKINSPDAHAYLSDRLWGIAYNNAMSNKLSLKKIKTCFDTAFTNDLNTFNAYSISVPHWLRTILINRLYLLIWLIQRKKTI